MNRPNLVISFLYLSFILNITSCAHNQFYQKITHLDFFGKWPKDTSLVSGEKKLLFGSREYFLTYNNIGNLLINSKEHKVIRMSKSFEKYLNLKIEKLILNSSTILGNFVPYEIYVIKSSIPFYFSLPGLRVFLSSELVRRFVRSEGLLLSILGHEVIRVQRNMFPLKSFTPSRQVKIENLMSEMRITFENRLLLNNWVFYSMLRANIDPYAYLLWIQVLNKNALDFKYNVTSLNSIALEEVSLKEFIVTSKLNDIFQSKDEVKSSKLFHRFAKSIEFI